jgi:hypothetical protein
MLAMTHLQMLCLFMWAPVVMKSFMIVTTTACVCALARQNPETGLPIGM